MNKYLHTIRNSTGELLTSYSLLFFSTSQWFGLLLLLVTFCKPYAGLPGLIAGVIAILLVKFSGLRGAGVQKGLFCYNAILIGVGMGSFFNWGFAFWLLLFLAVLLSILLSGVLMNQLFPKGLPFLAIPFTVCFWVVILVSREFGAIDLTTRNIYWLNQMYAIGDNGLVNFILYFENLPMHPLLLMFFKSVSSLFFQENVLAGIIISIGLLFHSRISFVLLVLGFLASIGFNSAVHAYNDGINYYLMGGNFLMVALAIGGIFMIPSVYSWLWALVAVPLTFLMVIATGKLCVLLGVPVFSLPFSAVTLLILYFFRVTQQTGRIILTPLQLYSPEKNLYHYLNTKKRLASETWFRFQLPFMGEWIVSQGYEGGITHKGDWSKALDFVIVDAQMKTYSGYALSCEDFYCYNKPVLAPADGYVQELIDQVEDNEIGKVNRQQNWGNTIILRHAEGLYTKICHLRKESFKVKQGEFVKKGQTIAACGNSGRSPEPHLHFQVQYTPYVGSKTVYYPFETFREKKEDTTSVRSFAVPLETAKVSNIITDENLEQAFAFAPGYRMEISADGFDTEYWEVFTDAYNQCYLYSHTQQSTAYFIKGSCYFYFTAFYGNRNSLLYQFYISAYHIALFTEEGTVVTDEFPLQWSRNNPGKWLQDFAAPFVIFRRLLYRSENRQGEGSYFDRETRISSRQSLQYPGFERKANESEIVVREGKIAAFSFMYHNQVKEALCTVKL